MRRTFLLAALTSLSLPTAGEAAPWPPRDPNEHDTTTDFTEEWALQLRRTFRTLADIQRAAGSRGKITERAFRRADPYVAYHWRSVTRDGSRAGFMLVLAFRSGRLEVSISTEERVLIDFDSEGGFGCLRCASAPSPMPRT